MAINTSKSKSMLVCTPQKRVRLFSDILNVRIGGVALDNVSDIKVLGADHLICGGAMVFPSGSNFFFDSQLKRTIFFRPYQKQTIFSQR